MSKNSWGGGKANLLFTDPPYNVNYDYAKYQDGRKKKWKKIFNDNLSDEDFKAFLTKCFSNAFLNTTENASYYVCCAHSTFAQFRDSLEDVGFSYSQAIIWVKDRFVLAMGQHFHRMQECIIHGWK